MSDQPYDFGPAFHYYDNVRTSNDPLETQIASNVANRIAESIAATLNDRLASLSAENAQHDEDAPSASDFGRDN